MALLFADGFSHYATGDLTQKGYTINAGSPTINAGNGRFGNDCLTVVQNSTISKSLGSNVSTLMVQFGFLRDATSSSTYTLLSLEDLGTVQVDIQLVSNEFVRIRVNGGSTTVFTAASALTVNRYYYFEVKVVFHASAGSVTVKQDGVTIYSASSLDTIGSANAYANMIKMISPNASGGMRYSDLIVMDTTGSFCNDLIGDKRIVTIVPNGAGNYTQFTPSAGSNFQCVDDTDPNGDTDYVESSTVGHKDTYTMGDTTALTAIKAVVVTTSAKKTDAGTRTIQHKVRSNGTDLNGADVVLSSSYAIQQTPFYQNPDGTVDWTNTTVSAVEAGMEVTA